MLEIRGVVTYSGELTSKSTGKSYSLVNLDGLRTFPVGSVVLPAVGQTVVARVAVEPAREVNGRKYGESFRLFGWEPG